MNIPRQSAWWKESVIYQIYPKSFYDSNNDGVGDIRGIIEKLPYLKTLGITVIWVSPFYRSPMADNGYDIADYFAVNPDFGSMQDVDELIARSGEMGIKVMIDLVVNHTSDEHAWFQQALADPESPYRDYYIFKPEVNGAPPNNWRSILAVARGKKSPAKRCTTSMFSIKSNLT
jgi:alpha-glucosidase